MSGYAYSFASLLQRLTGLDLLHALEVKYPVEAGQEPKERRVSSLPMIQSDHEDDPAEYESEEGDDGAEVDAEV